jgi:plastocyanin
MEARTTQDVKRKAAASGAAVAGLTLGIIIGAVITYALAMAVPLGKPYTLTSTFTVTSTRTVPSSLGNAFVSVLRGAGSNSSSDGYSPKTLVVVLGVNNTVVWGNFDNVTHTVTSSTGAEPFSSGNLQPGHFFYHTFSKLGTHSYACAYHRWMLGTVIVKG